MPIRFQYDAAAVAPPSSNELKKYGGQMLMQQRKYDLDQRNDQARISQIGAMRNFNAEPSIGEDDAMLDQEIRSGAYDPDTVRSLRDDQRAMRQIMRDRNIDATQRAQALGNLQSRMRMTRSTGKVQPVMQAQPSASRQPLSAAQAFAQSDKLEERFMGMVEPTSPDGTPMPYEERLKKAMSIYDTRQKMLFGQPQGQPQQGAPPAGQPQASYSGGSTEAGFGVPPVMAQGGFQGAGQSAYQPTGDYSSKPVFGVQPVLAQQAASQQAAPATPVATPQTAPTTTPAKRGARGYVSISPQGQSVTALGRNAMYNERGEFVGDPGLYDRQGADYIRQQTAGVQPVAQPVSTGRAGFDAAMGSNLDTAYDLANMDRSPGTNFFNLENPAYAAMRAPAPQQNTGNVGQFKGRYGLGGVDYGINPATGNRVTASIRPGGGLEFDEPIGKPGTAMGGRKGSVTIMGGKKKPVAEVSPGVSTPQQMAAYNALPEAPVDSPAAPSASGVNYQYQSPVAQSVATAPQSATPSRKYGGSSLTSSAGREVEAAMQAGEELAAREQAIGQQQAFQGATAPPPVPMSDEKRKELGLPTTKELKEMRRSMDQNRAMGGIGLGGTGRAAGSYSPPTSAQKPKESPKAGKPTSQQTVMSKAIKDFASKQPSDVQDAIRDAYDMKLSDRLRENAVRFLLSRGIDLEKMAPNS
jgi:hypothetical protein